MKSNGRVIKFRAWDKIEKEMIYNSMELHSRILGLDGNPPLKGDETKESYIGFSDWFEGQRFDMMQFTGLNDKNGKEIWEGDILHVIEEGDYGGEFYGVVEWLNNWSIYGIACTCVKEIAKSKTNTRVTTIFTRGFLTRRHGACIELAEIFTDIGAYQFSKAEVIGNIRENPELLEKK